MYDRCKATHRCNRAHAAFDPLNASWAFTKQVFRDGLHEPADAFFDFEQWLPGTAGWYVDPSFFDGYPNRTVGAHWNPFDLPLLPAVYLNHSATIVFDTDATTMHIVHEGSMNLSYALSPENSTAGVAMANSLDPTLYAPTPTTDQVWAGTLVATQEGTPAAAFNFPSFYIGPTVLVNTTGRRPLVLLSLTSLVVDTTIDVEPATLGGFPGARLPSTRGGVGSNEYGPGADSTRVQFWMVEAAADNVDEVQTFEVHVRPGQTLRGSFTLSFQGHTTHPLPADAEPGEVRNRIETGLPDAGRVHVARSAFDPLTGGYVWNVTFLTAVGDQPQIAMDCGALTGIGAGCSIGTLQDGNDLGGSFALDYNGTRAGPIAVTATATEVRDTLERDWAARGLLHAHVARTNALPRRSGLCADGRCTDSGPGPAWGVTWLLTLTFDESASGGEVSWPAPLSPLANATRPWIPITMDAGSLGNLTGAGARANVTAGHDQDLTSGLPRHEFADVVPLSLAYGGAGASHGAMGGLGHARHGPAASVGVPETLDLVGGSGGAMGGETPQQALVQRGPAYLATDAGAGCAQPATVADRPGHNTGCPGAGGAGGGAIELIAVHDLVLGPSSAILVDGTDAEDGWRGGGGGAGGMIVLAAGSTISIHGPLSAVGGGGGRGTGTGSRGGGGGSGGRVAAYAQSVELVPPNGVVIVDGGVGGLDAELAISAACANATFSSNSTLVNLVCNGTLSAWNSTLAASFESPSTLPLGDGSSPANAPSLDGVGSLDAAAVGIGVPGGVDNGVVRTASNAHGQRGSVNLISASGAQYRVDPVYRGAAGTQRALRVAVAERVITDSDVLRAAPFAQHGPSFALPLNGTGTWWMRRGANYSLPPDAPASVSSALDRYASGSAPVSAAQVVGPWGGSGMDGTPDWNPGSRPQRVTVYVRLGGYARGKATDNWGPHIALHEMDYRNGSARAVARTNGSIADLLTGSAEGDPGGPAGPYGAGIAADGAEGGGVGGDAEVMIGVAVRDGKWVHGANYRHTPGVQLHPESRQTVAARHVELMRWYKIDIFIQWTNQTYRLRVDDVTVALDQPFSGTTVRRLGLYLFHEGVAWFDEVYAGPDDTMGFECPMALADGSLRIRRPIQSGWVLDDIGGPSYDWNITRHDNHVSQRDMYTHPSHAGLVYGDGAPHERYRRDIKTITPDGDHNATFGDVWAGQLLYIPADAPMRSLIERATTTAGELSDGTWAAAPDSLRLVDSADGRLGYGGVESIDAQDGFGAARFHMGRTGRFFWYGEHDSTEPPRNLSALFPGVADVAIISRGGVVACSTSDLESWRNEGVMFRFENITTAAEDPTAGHDPVTGELVRFRSERPKTIYNNLTDTFVMWQHVDASPNRTYRAAGVALSAWPNGPFSWRHTLWPDGNETTDLTLLQNTDTGEAFLARTYYETIDYWMPRPIMQPVWESVKTDDGSTNYALNFHRAFYHKGYDNPDDVYLQRWRHEDIAWNITINEWNEVWDNDAGEFVLSNHITGDVRRYTATDRDFIHDVTLDPYAFRQIHGQGRPVIRSRYLDPNTTENSAWTPSSVPAVRAQSWQDNYEDKNIADNPPHPTVPDLLIGPEQIVTTRRTKYVAISALNLNYTNTTGILRILEGEMENQTDLIAVMSGYGSFGWEPGNTTQSTWGYSRHATIQPFGFRTEVDWEDRHWQYNNTPNDRAQDYRNFRDRQTSSECPDIHRTAMAKKEECLYILNNVLAYEDAPTKTNFTLGQRSYARALDTSKYETCLAEHRQLLNDFQVCTRKSVPVYSELRPWDVGVRECVGGGGQCGPPPGDDEPLATYGYGADAPNYTAIYGTAAGFERPREHFGEDDFFQNFD